EPRDISAPGDGQQLCSAGRPPYAVIVAGGTKDVPDAARLVREVITRVVRIIHPVQDPAPVGMDQPAQERTGEFSCEVALPGQQFDRALMFRPRPVLREQAWPVLPRSIDDDASPRTGVTHTPSADGHHRSSAFGDDVRIPCVEADP